MSRFSVVSLLAILVLAGCGGSSRHAKAEKQVTVPAYGTYGAVTEAVTTGTPALCRREAQAFTRDGVSFLVPSATPADDYFIGARTQFFDFEAHRCDAQFLRKALSRRLNVNQRRTLFERLPFLPASITGPSASG